MVRIVSCRFLRLSCTEDDHPLFRRYYTRSNRERGVKLLRCFPHCCPEHVQRCYCGTSIHVQVTFAAIVPPVEQGNLLVCARFEPSSVVPLWLTNISGSLESDATPESERKLQPGEVVALPTSLLAVDKRKPDKTVWIRAVREGEVKQKTLPQNTVLYVLNNHRFPKWQYSYDSSVARTQREMTHHLVVYVFQLTGSRARPGEIHAVTLARHESPGFSLTSYRRSGNNSGAIGCDVPALDSASSTKFAAVKVDISALASVTDTMTVNSIGQSMPLSNILDRETKIGGAPACPRTFTSTGNNFDPQFAADSTAAFWAYDVRAYRSDLAEKAKHLLILWRFLNYVTLEDAGVTPDTLNVQIRSHWLRAARVLQTSQGARASQLESVMSSLLLSLCRGTQAFQTATREQVVVQASAHLLLRALSSRAVQYALQSAIAVQGGRMNVRERFVVLVSDIYDILGDLCRLGSSDAASVFPGGRISLPALVDEIISLVYTRSQFTGLRDEISGLLRGQLTSHTGTIERLFGYFTAQIQEFIAAAQLGPDLFTQLRGHDNSWNRTWLLEPDSIQVTSIRQGHRVSVKPSLVEFSRWVYEFACIEVAFNETDSRLSVRSVLPTMNGIRPTEFLLDSRLRTFRSTPSGISSTLPVAGRWSIGDYAARFSGQTKAIEIEFYAYRGNTLGTSIAGHARSNGQVETSTTVLRISMTFELEKHFHLRNLPAPVDIRDRFIVIRGVVSQAPFDHSYPTTLLDPQPELAKMSITTRSAVLQELQWATELEIQGGYVAVPT